MQQKLEFDSTKQIYVTYGWCSGTKGQYVSIEEYLDLQMTRRGLAPDNLVIRDIERKRLARAMDAHGYATYLHDAFDHLKTAIDDTILDDRYKTKALESIEEARRQAFSELAQTFDSSIAKLV